MPSDMALKIEECLMPFSPMNNKELLFSHQNLKKEKKVFFSFFEGKSG